MCGGVSAPCIQQLIIGERLLLLIQVSERFRMLAQQQLRVRLCVVEGVLFILGVHHILGVHSIRPGCPCCPVVCRSGGDETGCADVRLLAAQPHRALHRVTSRQRPPKPVSSTDRHRSQGFLR